MKKIFAVLALIGLAACTSTDLETKVADLEKRVTELENINRPALYRKYFDARMSEDRKTYPDDFRKIESLYHASNKADDKSEQKKLRKELIEKYPLANRTGCTVLYIGQITQGKEQEEFLLKAIKEYDNCWYGDGVQVGAYARIWLADNYKKAGKQAEADKLYEELRKNYPDAIDHRGRLLRDMIPEQK